MIEVANFSPFQRQMPMMHDNKGMLALERHRASPPSTLTPLQPVSQEMYTSVIRKTYDASSAVPVSAIESSTGQHNRLVFFFFCLDVWLRSRSLETNKNVKVSVMYLSYGC